MRRSCVETVAVWTTDKDGIVLDLLASEIRRSPVSRRSERYRGTDRAVRRPGLRQGGCARHQGGEGQAGQAVSRRRTADTLAGEKITDRLVTAPGNGAAIGGLKVVTENAWFAARPSGTEDVYKIYAESFLGPDHLARVQQEAREVVAAALAG